MIELKETKPPWIVFPEMQPTDLRATQGAEELWLGEDWWPFWMTITEKDRNAYLLRWKCDADWRDNLDYYTRIREEYDEEQDIKDRERYLAERKIVDDTEGCVRHSWFSRIFFRKKVVT